MAVDRYALCVGINEYANPNSNLSGCVNDANDWADLLESRGYQVTRLLNSDATRDNFLEALREQVAKLEYLDRLVFTYSGHGSWVPDYNGDEVDGRDEALVMQDLSLVKDDDLYPILQQRAYGSRMTTLSDSCHSGTVIRGLAEFAGDEDGPRPRFMSPTLLDVAPKADLYAAAQSEARSLARNSGLLISGSADPEYSYDAWFNGPSGWRANGAFTRAAIDTFDPSQTMQKWYDRIRTKLPTDQYPQTPQLQGTWYQKNKALALA